MPMVETDWDYPRGCLRITIYMTPEEISEIREIRRGQYISEEEKGFAVIERLAREGREAARSRIKKEGAE